MTTTTTSTVRMNTAAAVAAMDVYRDQFFAILCELAAYGGKNKEAINVARAHLREWLVVAEALPADPAVAGTLRMTMSDYERDLAFVIEHGRLPEYDQP